MAGEGGLLAGDFKQEGETVTGNAQLTNSMFSVLEVRGRFDGENLQLDALSGGRRAATLTGKLVGGNLLEGRYSVPSWDSGTWTARKVRP